MSTVLLVSPDAAFCDALRGTFNTARQVSLKIVAQALADVGDLDAQGDFSLALIDLDAARPDQMAALERLIARIGGRAPVIVLTDSFDPSIMRALMQMRVADFLCKPVKPDEALRAALKLISARNEAARSDAHITCFIPAAGGVGNTTLAVESAIQLTRRGGERERTCLVDLDFTNEACADFLDLEPRLDLAEVGPRGERLDLQLLEALCSRHKSGLSLVASPAQPAQELDIDVDAIMRLLDVVAMRYDHVVIDLPRTWRPWTDAILGASNRIYVVTDMTVPGLRFARRLSDKIAERLDGPVQPQVIVNRFTSGVGNGLRASDVEKALNGSYAGSVGNNYGLVREAIDRGLALEDVRPNNNVSADIARILFSETAPTTWKSRAIDFFSRF